MNLQDIRKQAFQKDEEAFAKWLDPQGETIQGVDIEFWETGKRFPDGDQIRLLRAKLGYSAEWLLDEAFKQKKAAPKPKTNKPVKTEAQSFQNVGA